MGTADIRFLLHNFLPTFWNTSVFWNLLGSCLFPLCMKFSCESMVRNGENVGNVSTLVTIVVFLGFLFFIFFLLLLTFYRTIVRETIQTIERQQEEIK